MLHTVIFIGRSGCGKGTQVKLLQEELKRRRPDDKIFYMQTGQRFREFIQEEGYSNKLSRAIYDEGERQPDFLAVWVWASMFLENIRNEEHLFIDGFPRSLYEAHMLDTAMKFYNREKPCVVHLRVTRAWSEERLLERGRREGRSDDIDIRDVRRRLDWFEDDVIPAVNFYRENPEYRFIEVHGERSIEEVQSDLREKIFSAHGAHKDNP